MPNADKLRPKAELADLTSREAQAWRVVARIKEEQAAQAKEIERLEAEVAAMREALESARIQIQLIGTPEDAINNAVLAMVNAALPSPYAGKRILAVVAAAGDYIKTCDIPESSGHQITLARNKLRDALSDAEKEK